MSFDIDRNYVIRRKKDGKYYCATYFRRGPRFDADINCALHLEWDEAQMCLARLKQWSREDVQDIYEITKA